ncbi:MAG: radical SAM protein [Synergistales bacterium]|nr:radical SAM protein [Synergistales bacterium]
MSPYVRYLYGVLSVHGFEPLYRTCDSWREQPDPVLWNQVELIAVIAGIAVPGRYRGGSPLTLAELEGLARMPRRGPLVVGGAISRGYTLQGGSTARKVQALDVDCFCTGDPEAVVDHFLKTGAWVPGKRRTYQLLQPWATEGARLIPHHPGFPWLTMEMELSRGCTRNDGHCSFCTEGWFMPVEERDVSMVTEEVAALAEQGADAFRLGRCSDILTYGGNTGSPADQPSPGVLEKLYKGVRCAAPSLAVLHTDNCNPRGVVRYPGAAAEAIGVIASQNTAGDILSFGIESLDPEVLRRNNLKVSAEEAFTAVEVVNTAAAGYSARRMLPSLLPGLNLLFGLAGERNDSLDWVTALLERLLASALTVRRINIRRVMVFPELPLHSLLEEHPSRLKHARYRRWKRWVREEVDPVFLRRVAPFGTIIKGVRLEGFQGNTAFGRPRGSYPLLVGLPGCREEIGSVRDVAVVGQGGRSVTAVPYPFNPNHASPEMLRSIPGFGNARVKRLVAHRPFQDTTALAAALDDPGLLSTLRPLLAENEDPFDAQ